MTTYKIHPAIGVARLGTSDDFYIAPEVPGGLPTSASTGEPVTSFRDANGHLLKQAQRFRVFAYDDGAAPAEVKPGSNGVAAIEWTVYLANKKSCWYQFKQLTGSGQEGDAGYIANGPKVNPLRDPKITDPAERQKLIIDPGPRTVGGQGNPVHAEFDASGPFSQPANLPFPVTSLGSIDLDHDGHLLVIGASGAAGTTNVNPKGWPYEYVLTQYANNEGWFDDVADGPVHATLVMQDGTRVPVDVPAWCLSAPPRYAPQIMNLVTLWDTMYDVAVREMQYRPDLYGPDGFNPDYLVDFAAEIQPFLPRAAGYSWVADIGRFGTRRHQALTSGAGFPLGVLRTVPNDDPTAMPLMAGDNPLSKLTVSKYLTVSPTQYFLLSQWVNGKVRTTPLPPPTVPEQLDKAALENCTGGAFCPGIEMTWVCRNTTIYAEAFRLRVKPDVTKGALQPLYGNDNDYTGGLEPGDVSKYMAQPWQADFFECTSQPIDDSGTYWWWPAERPVDVVAVAGAPLVDWTRGFANDSKPNLGGMQTVICWQDLGFVLQQADNSFLEVERNTAAIDAYQPPLRKDVKIPIVAKPAAAATGPIRRTVVDEWLPENVEQLEDEI